MSVATRSRLRLWLLASLCLLPVALRAASSPAEVALRAQRAWRQGDGETLLQLAHPTLVARIARLQLRQVEQVEQSKVPRAWVRAPHHARTAEQFRRLPAIEQARWYFIGMREILGNHGRFSFTFETADEQVDGDHATVTVIEHQRAEGRTSEVRYPFVLERVGDRWLYVSGGSERFHIDTQTMLLER